VKEVKEVKEVREVTLVSNWKWDRAPAAAFRTKADRQSVS